MIWIKNIDFLSFFFPSFQPNRKWWVVRLLEPSTPLSIACGLAFPILPAVVKNTQPRETPRQVRPPGKTALDTLQRHPKTPPPPTSLSATRTTDTDTIWTITTWWPTTLCPPRPSPPPSTWWTPSVACQPTRACRGPRLVASCQKVRTPVSNTLKGPCFTTPPLLIWLCMDPVAMEISHIYTVDQSPKIAPMLVNMRCWYSKPSN